MKNKLFFPVILCAILFVIVLCKCLGGGKKIFLDYQSELLPNNSKNSIVLKVYVENSGSMDAYMCSGSNLKDAVFDYVSDLHRLADTCSLNYINSKIIPYKGNLRSFIKDLTPSSFAAAGGNRKNTDLMQIFENILKEHTPNTISIFVSDCILDLPQNSIDFLGNCQISIKNTFNEALSKNPYMGVEIIKLQSKFEGYWYCGHNSEFLKDVKRPYYIWIIGNQNYLAELNKKVPIENIIGGIKEYSAYAASQPIPFDIEKKDYVINHTGKIKVEILVNLNGALQSRDIYKNIAQYKTDNPNQVKVISVDEIIEKTSKYSHMITLEIQNPKTIHSETVTFSYPNVATWVSNSDDTSGENVKANLNRTTGLMALIKGVAEAYKDYSMYGSISFELKNK